MRPGKDKVNDRTERLVTIPIALAISFAAVAGTATVFYQTRIANPSLDEYFSFLTIGRLLVLSHVHMFGYATMGFVLWTQGRRIGAAANPRFAQLLAITVAAGVLDVLSWWAVAYVNHAFRFLMFAAGGGFVGGILLSALLVLLTCIRGAPRAR